MKICLDSDEMETARTTIDENAFKFSAEIKEVIAREPETGFSTKKKQDETNEKNTSNDRQVQVMILNTITEIHFINLKFPGNNFENR